ncbi:hypothetical protein Osc1_10830 [Hominimerdicola sp. 21CYCFAH17_S]
MIQREIVGTKTVNGIEIKGQSKHFLERFFGTMANPSDKNHKPRSGISFEDLKEALYKGKDLKPKVSQNKISQQLYISRCEVSINPSTGILIQCNPNRRKNNEI